MSGGSASPNPLSALSDAKTYDEILSIIQRAKEKHVPFDKSEFAYCYRRSHIVKREDRSPRHGDVETGDSMQICRECREQDQKLRAVQEEGDKAVALFDKIASVADTSQKAQVELADLMGGIYDHYGGVPGFCARMLGQLDAAMLEKPGSARVLKFFVDVMRLTYYANRMRQEDDIEHLHGEQLDKEIKLEAIKIAMSTLEGQERLTGVLQAADAVGLDISQPPRPTTAEGPMEYMQRVIDHGHGYD